ncbi:hypothetical protein FA10DRAFT_265671 [Acaromyces ingoldii]|uniref:FAD-binding domain-containing protein n=1 Tax=Acaromyces ingoldii TaxID=215250 RepID=A0A316YVP8_9BASI|nr:hypothetical protein FA10DRAFT_265671 [Acaromyces ingoldii]PWN91835.1 hypothetical protein FA10DRAFT_265671 [Acaromyces ingoldii]
MTLTRDSAPDLALFSEPVRFKSRNSDALSEFEVPSDYLYWVLVGDEKRFPKGRTREAQALKKVTLEMTVGWHPSVRAVLEEQSIDESQLLPIRSTRPQDVTLLRNRDDLNVVILLGDALHAMTPAGGSGANTALIDAQLLVQLLIDEDKSDDVYLKYHRKMTGYAPKAVEKSVAGGKHIFGMSSINEWTIWTPQEKDF